jgi:hypothetical protein
MCWKSQQCQNCGPWKHRYYQHPCLHSRWHKIGASNSCAPIASPQVGVRTRLSTQEMQDNNIQGRGIRLAVPVGIRKCSGLSVHAELNTPATPCCMELLALQGPHPQAAEFSCTSQPLAAAPDTKIVLTPLNARQRPAPLLRLAFTVQGVAPHLMPLLSKPRQPPQAHSVFSQPSWRQVDIMSHSFHIWQ